MADRQNRRDSSALHQLPGDTDIEELYERLRIGDDPVIRERAAELLGSLTGSAEKYDEEELVRRLLRAAISDTEPTVQARAIDSLYLHDRRHVDRLVTELAAAVEQDGGDAGAFFRDWLEAAYPEFRMVAASAVREFGDDPASALEDAFDDSDARVRTRAVRSYGRLEESGAVEPVESLLRDRNPQVRQAAAAALANIGTDAALSALVPVARAQSAQLREVAVSNLGDLDTPRAGNVLLGSLTDEARTVRWKAMASLVRLFLTGEAISGADVRQTLVADADVDEREEIAISLRDTLEEVGEPAVRRHAVWLLGVLATAEEEESRGWLVDRLTDRDEVVADIAAASLRQLEGKQLEKRLRLLVQDTDAPADARERAQSVLEKIEQDTAASIEAKSIEYTYVSEPSDYTASRSK